MLRGWARRLDRKRHRSERKRRLAGEKGRDEKQVDRARHNLLLHVRLPLERYRAAATVAEGSLDTLSAAFTIFGRIEARAIAFIRTAPLRPEACGARAWRSRFGQLG